MTDFRKFTGGFFRFWLPLLLIALLTFPLPGAESDKKPDPKLLEGLKTKLEEFSKTAQASQKRDDLGKEIIEHYGILKNNKLDLMKKGVSKDLFENFDNWKRQKLLEAFGAVKDKENVYFLRMGSSADTPQARATYEACKSDDDIIPMLSGYCKGDPAREVSDKFLELTGVELKNADIGFLEQFKVKDFNTRAFMSSNPEMYTTKGGNKMVQMWLYQRGSLTRWDPKLKKYVEAPIKSLFWWPEPERLELHEAIGYYSDNTRQMNINILDKSDLDPPTKLKKAFKYVKRNRQSFVFLGSNFTDDELETYWKIHDMVKKIESGGDSLKNVDPNECAKLLDRVRQLNMKGYMRMHENFLDQLDHALEKGKTKLVQDMLEEYAGAHYNVVQSLSDPNIKSKLLTRLKEVTSKRTNKVLCNAIYQAVEKSNNIDDAVKKLKILGDSKTLEKLKEITDIPPLEMDKIVPGKKIPEIDPKLLDCESCPYFKKCWGDSPQKNILKKVPGKHWIITDEELTALTAKFRKNRLDKLVKKASLTQKNKEKLLKKINGFAKRQLDKEIARFWMNQKNRFIKLPPDAQQQIRRSASLYKSLQNSIDNAQDGAAALKAKYNSWSPGKQLAFRQAMFTSGIIFSMYAWYSYQEGPEAAWKLVKAAFPAIAKGAAKDGAVEYYCLHVLKQAGRESLGKSLFAAYTAYQLTSLGAELLFSSTFDKPMLNTLYALYFTHLELNHADLGKKLDRNRGNLWKYMEISDIDKTVDEFFNSPEAAAIKGLNFRTTDGGWKQKFRQQVVSDWMSGGGKEYLEAMKKYRPQLLENKRLQKVLSAEEDNTVNVILTGLEMVTKKPLPGKTIKVKAAMLAGGGAGDKVLAQVKFSFIGPGGSFKTQLRKKYFHYSKTDIDASETVKSGFVTTEFDLPKAVGKCKVIAENLARPEDKLELVFDLGESVNVFVSLHRQYGKKQTDQPVLNGKVVLHKSGKEFPFDNLGKGVYKLKNIFPGNYRVTASASNYNAPDGGNEVELKLEIPVSEKENPPPVKRTMYLCPVPGKITVRVTAPDGRTLDHAELKLSVDTPGLPLKNSSYLQFRKSAQGEMEFSGLHPGKYTVFAKAKSCQAESGGFQASKPGIVVDTVNPEAATPLPVVIKLKPIMSEVTVKVVSPDSKPLENATVKIGNNNETTGADGRCTLKNIPPSFGKSHDIRASHEFYPDAVVSKPVNPEKPGDKIPEVLLKLEGGTVKVKVVDQDGKPVNKAVVKLQEKNSVEQTTDAKGQTEFKNLPAVEWWASAEKTGYRGPEDKKVHLKPGEKRSVELILKEGIILKVHTKYNKNGSLVPAFPAYAALDGTSEKFGPTGVFTFDPVSVKESINVIVRGDGFSRETLNFKATETEIAKGIAYRNVELKPELTLEVTIRNQADSTLIKESCCVELSGPAGFGRTASTSTGDCTFQKLNPGTYKAKVTCKGWENGSASATLSAGATGKRNELAVKLRQILSSISARVKLEGGSGDESTPTVTISAAGSSSKGASATFSKLKNGIYTVSATAKGYGSASKKVEIYAETAGKTYSVALKLTKKATPEGEETEEEKEETEDGEDSGTKMEEGKDEKGDGLDDMLDQVAEIKPGEKDNQEKKTGETDDGKKPVEKPGSKDNDSDIDLDKALEGHLKDDDKKTGAKDETVKTEDGKDTKKMPAEDKSGYENLSEEELLKLVKQDKKKIDGETKEEKNQKQQIKSDDDKDQDDKEVAEEKNPVDKKEDYDYVRHTGRTMNINGKDYPIKEVFLKSKTGVPYEKYTYCQYKSGNLKLELCERWWKGKKYREDEYAIFIIDGKPKSMLHGKRKEYSRKSGKLMSETDYRKGRKHGWDLSYNASNSVLIGKAAYKNGKRDGASWRFNEKTGKKSSLVEYRDDVQHGKEMYWDKKTGTLTARKNYKMGKQDGRQMYYTSSGKPRSMMTYRNGKRHGKSKEWDWIRTGKIEKDEDWKNGDLFKIVRYTYDYKTGKLTKKELISYNKNWKAKRRQRRHGLYELHLNGRLNQSGNYVNGKMSGSWKYWNKYDKSYDTLTYVNGEIKSGKRTDLDSLNNTIYMITYSGGKIIKRREWKLDGEGNVCKLEEYEYYPDGKTKKWIYGPPAKNISYPKFRFHSYTGKEYNSSEKMIKHYLVGNGQRTDFKVK